MKIRTSIMSTPALLVVSLLLSGCISTSQTKALITPIGVIGVHSFAPPQPAPRSTDFEQRVAQRATSASNHGAERS